MIMGDMGKENLSKNVCRCSSLIRGTDAINSGLNKIVPHGINQIELLLQQVQIIIIVYLCGIGWATGAFC